MSEERFMKECGNNGMTCRIWDNGLPMTTDEVVDTLNEQQSTIQSLKEENEALKKFIKDNFNEMMDSKMVIDDE